ncbi:MAG: site-specific DNA-methyltransferase [Verrucomicrobia bacterium]|nr:MAG: site-specific DNA-methyltransferase [Verrucomicrobiota bacterium]
MKGGPAVQLDLSLTPVTSGEFWTARQRAGNSLHEISYRACFKPPLARYFIERFSAPGDVVYDPFMGRGTTPLEAALVGRIPWGRDSNPLSKVLLSPRLLPPSFEEVENRLGEINFSGPETAETDDLLVFFHPETLRAILALRHYLNEKAGCGTLDPIDAWIRMVAINRLTGHSPGFFSVYSMPPNQAVSVKSQRRINERRKQEPPVRDVPRLILRKTKALLKDATPDIRATLDGVNDGARITIGDARSAPELSADSAELVLTSPPFLDVVDYATDNWLRCWFAGIDLDEIRFDQHRRVEDWCTFMAESIGDTARILKPGGTLALEIGEVRAGTIRLEEHIAPLGNDVGLKPVEILINDQSFTKTAHTWGVTNNTRGTNTNRVVVFRKT